MRSSSHLVKTPSGASCLVFGQILCSVENAEAQQIEAGAAVHGALDELEAVDLAFDRAIAPGLLKSCDGGGFVVA